MMSVVCDGRKELPAGASREYSSYCGNYTFDGEKLVTRVDAASDLSRNGGDQVRGCASKARTWSSFPRHGEPAGSRNTARSPGNASRRSKAAHSLTYCEIRARTEMVASLCFELLDRRHGLAEGPDVVSRCEELHRR